MPNYEQTIERVRTVAQSRNEMFYTPKDKNAMDAWLKQMPREMPTAIALMIGYNYALKQIENIVDEGGQ